jgi:uncharacterized protein (TIGR00369 family)
LSFVVDGDELLARFTPTTDHQGPLGLMHGGLVSTLADEAAAWVVLASTGKFGFTTQFDARLLRGVRIGVETETRARLVKATSRVVRASVTVSQQSEVCFRGEFTFVVLDQAGAEKVLGAPVPEAWARFCR